MEEDFLLIDIGNTKSKIALACAAKGTIETVTALPTKESAKKDFEELFLQIRKKADVKKAYISVVVHETLYTKVLNAIKTSFGAIPCALVPKTQTVPLATAYTTKKQLGADRHLAAYAARKLYTEENLIIVDAGSALTVDCVRKDIFIGGFILPGLSMAYTALHTQTDALPLVPYAKNIDTFRLGTSTEECIQFGVTFGYQSMIEGLILKIKAYLNAKAYVIGTGGDPNLFSHLACVDTVEDNLVLKGLFTLACELHT